MSQTPLKDNQETEQGSSFAESAPDLKRSSVMVIEPPHGFSLVILRELWQYRELLFNLTWRDVKVRYKQTVLGFAWTIVQPLITMVVFTVFFGKLMGMAERVSEISEAPYPVYLYAGLLPWNLFVGGLTGASTSVVSSRGVLTKIYFPRLLIPLAAIGVTVVNFLVSSAILLIMMLAYGIVPGVEILLFPLLLLITCLASLAFGIGLSALMVEYRDLQYLVGFLTQTLFFLAPVIYPVTLIPEAYRWLLALNPMTGLIGCFRYCVLGRPFEWYTMGVSLIVIFVGLGCSIVLFRRYEIRFADII